MEIQTQIATLGTPANIEKFPGFFSLVAETFRMYKLKWKTLIKINLALYASAAATMAAAFLIAIGGGVIATSFKNYVFFLILAALATVAAICLMAYFGSWFSAATIIVLRDSQETMGFREAAKRAKPYIIPFIFINIIAGAAIAFGYIFFVIPGIIFSVWLMAARYVIFRGNERGFDALVKSRDYARGYFWNVFSMSIAGGIAFSIVSAVIDLLNNSDSGRIISYLVSFFVAPFATIYYYLIFDHLRKIKGDAIIVKSDNLKSSLKAFVTIGIVLIVIAISLLVYCAPQIKNAYDNYQTQHNRLDIHPKN